MLTTLVLAAGVSKRFFDVFGPHYPPKQFLSFKATTAADPAQMWENAIRSVTLDDRLYVAFREDHRLWLTAPVRRRDAGWIWLAPTQGQADTMLQALRAIPQEGELLVVNCDNGFAPGVLNRLVHEGRHYHSVAAITMQVSGEHRWSWVDGHPRFHSAAEKRMISPFALAGAYYFPSLEEAHVCVERAVNSACETMINAQTGEATLHAREPYLSEMFRWLPDPKISVEIDKNHFYDWGTPAALNDFIRYEIK